MTLRRLGECNALMGRRRAWPLSTHSQDSTFVSCSKIDTQLSSPVITLSKKWGSSQTLDRFCSLRAMRSQCWFSVKMWGTNLGVILDKFMSFSRLCARRILMSPPPEPVGTLFSSGWCRWLLQSADFCLSWSLDDQFLTYPWLHSLLGWNGRTISALVCVTAHGFRTPAAWISTFDVLPNQVFDRTWCLFFAQGVTAYSCWLVRKSCTNPTDNHWTTTWISKSSHMSVCSEKCHELLAQNTGNAPVMSSAHVSGNASVSTRNISNELPNIDKVREFLSIWRTK